MARVFEGQRTFLHPVLRPVERLAIVSAECGKTLSSAGPSTSGSLLAFSLASFLFVYLIQRLQGWLPFNPQGFSTAHAPNGATSMTPDLAFNTAASFLTNTNWQAYAGEVDVELFHPDGRAGGAELRLRGGGHRGCHRVGARIRAPAGQ